MAEIVNITVQRQVQQVVITAERTVQQVLITVTPVSLATAEEINAGVMAVKTITPKTLGESIYRRIYVQAEEPQAPREGDLWVKSDQ